MLAQDNSGGSNAAEQRRPPRLPPHPQLPICRREWEEDGDETRKNRDARGKNITAQFDVAGEKRKSAVDNWMIKGL